MKEKDYFGMIILNGGYSGINIISNKAEKCQNGWKLMNLGGFLKTMVGTIPIQKTVAGHKFKKTINKKVNL